MIDEETPNLVELFSNLLAIVKFVSANHLIITEKRNAIENSPFSAHIEQMGAIMQKLAGDGVATFLSSLDATIVQELHALYSLVSRNVSADVSLYGNFSS